MNNPGDPRTSNKWPTLADFPLPAKALVSMVILTMAFAMVGALGQIIVHDIIPTFFSGHASGAQSVHAAQDMKATAAGGNSQASSGRGDLFSDVPATTENEASEPVYKSEQFVWMLKWTHIHLFGMNMIFIFMGVIVIFLNISWKARTWLVVLPFIGVLLDIASVWLKGYISPAFFWLHIPGGGLFGIVFAIVSIRACWEMWIVRKNYAQ